MIRIAMFAVPALIAVAALGADWPTVHGNALRTGYTADEVRPPYRRLWAAEFPGEILTTRVEAIVAGGKVFVGTQSGTLWALDADTGRVAWKKSDCGPILHSPSAADGRVFFGDASRTLWCLDASTGRVRWTFESGKGGFCASPLVAAETVYIGSRDGTFYAVDAAGGELRWKVATGGPIRNTAALAGENVVFASDDMHAYCLSAEGGKVVWKSGRLYGQSFRDYYPVIAGGKVILRSVLVAEMNQDLNGGTGFLMRNAGAKSLSWGDKTSFPHTPEGQGTPAQHRKEQQEILKLLRDNPWRRTCFVLDADTGAESVSTPVMYAAGNQGCGFPPALTGEGKPIIFYRTAYGRWHLGVKPAVGVGYLDTDTGFVEHIHHDSGPIPPWDTFWGTCDESTTFSVGGNVLYICHQGTLSGMDLKTRKLFKIHGKRDTWGGMAAVPWSANEWHGPARGACAIAGDRLYYVTGSRVICILGNGAEPPAKPPAKPAPPAIRVLPDIPAKPAPLSAEAIVADVPPAPKKSDAAKTQTLRRELAREVEQLLDGRPWAPFYCSIGIGSRDFVWAHPSFAVEALAAAQTHLSADLATRARKLAADQLANCLTPRPLALDKGRRRELFSINPKDLYWPNKPDWPHISHVHAVWFYGHRTGDWDSVEAVWPRVRAAWDAHVRQFGGKYQPQIFMNRLAAGVAAYARLAKRFGREQDVKLATEDLDRALKVIGVYYHGRADACGGTLRKVQQGARYGAAGRHLYMRVPKINHQQKMAVFMDLTPALARALAKAQPEATETLRQYVELYMPTYYLAFEERQVHYGENFIELPDGVHGIFRAKALLWGVPPETLAAETDLPWTKADLFHLEKLVLAVEALESKAAADE